MLLDAWEERLGFPDLIKRVTDEMKAEYGVSEEPIIRPLIGPARVNVTAKKIDLLLIEDKGSGISLRQMLERQNINAYAYNPGRADKLTRLHAVSHLFAAGVVWVPEGWRMEGRERVFSGDFVSWARPAIDQWVTFSGSGSIPHDEHVDCASQALRLLSDRNMLDQVRPRTAKDVAEEEDAAAERYATQQGYNPYAV